MCLCEMFVGQGWFCLSPGYKIYGYFTTTLLHLFMWTWPLLSSCIRIWIFPGYTPVNIGYSSEEKILIFISFFRGKCQQKIHLSQSTYLMFIVLIYLCLLFRKLVDCWYILQMISNDCVFVTDLHVKEINNFLWTF